MPCVATFYAQADQSKTLFSPVPYKRSYRSMLLVAGLSLKNLKPRVWDTNSPYYLPNLRAVMVSYADFHRLPAHRPRAMTDGLHTYLDIPEQIMIYLDNG